MRSKLVIPVYRYWVRYTGTDDLRITDLIIRIDHACVNRQNPGRPRCARCCCDFTRTSMPGASHVHLQSVCCWDSGRPHTMVR